MFEKEAEEYRKELKSNTFLSEPQLDLACQCFKDDAEFGYNKGNEEIKLLKETHRQSIDILVEQIEELHKANEWHYVKDGDLPKEDIYLVIRLNDENTCYKYCTGFWEKEERCFHTLFCNKVDTKDIIAWKEIEPPKEIKEK